MDFLDPEKQKAHARRLILGYVLIGLVLLLGTIILLYLAKGFGLDKNGRVIQNGLVFLSSHPEGSDVYVNGQKQDQTNARLTLPAGSYTAEVRRNGYGTWRRTITVEGGSVERFDYPFLYPSQLTTVVTRQYATLPVLSTQSLDRRWVLVANTPDQFDLFDMEADVPSAKQLKVPVEIYAVSSTTKGWEAVEWADDNRHVVLKRMYDKNGQPGSEYILFDSEKPEESRNLTITLGVNPTTMLLRDGKFDQYYLFDQNAHQVLTATLKKPTPQSFLKDALAFTAGKDLVMYATPDKATGGARTQIRLWQDGETYLLRQTPKSDTYLLRMSQYEGAWLVAAGATEEDKVYVYRNPLAKLRDKKKPVLVPVQILKVDAPAYVSFSTNGRYVMAENGGNFAVYDAERDKGYAHELKTPFDAGQEHAFWMDGYHMTAVSDGKLVVFDYDGANATTLTPILPGTTPFFTRDYNAVYALNQQNALTVTPLLTPDDQ